MSSPPCLSSVATRLQSQKGACSTESCVWRLWMPTAPRSTARFASTTSSLPMCPSLLTTMVRYVLSCSSKSAGVGSRRPINISLSLCYRNTITLPVTALLFLLCRLCYQLSVESLNSILSSVFSGGCPLYKNTHAHTHTQ